MEHPTSYFFFSRFSFSVFVHCVCRVLFRYRHHNRCCLFGVPPASRLRFPSFARLLTSCVCAAFAYWCSVHEGGGPREQRCWSSLTLSLLTARCEYHTRDSSSPEGPPRGVTRRFRRHAPLVRLFHLRDVRGALVGCAERHTTHFSGPKLL